jgi:hypothetical protein
VGETFGDFMGDLGKLPHGAEVDADILTRFTNNRMQAMLARFPWTRLDSNVTIQVPAFYDTGTIAVSEGGTALTLTGGTFTAAMTGRRIRITATREEYYTFTFLTGSTGTIDRAYEDTTETEATFRIWKAIYTLPELTDYLQSIAIPRLGRDLDQVSQEYLDSVVNDPGRTLYGDPQCYAPAPDSAAGLPQIELWPGPEIAEGLIARYRTDVVRFRTQDTSLEFPDWIDTQVLFVGVEADLYGLHENLTMKGSKEQDWKDGLKSMVNADIQRMAPSVLRMADEWTQHRVERAASAHGKIGSWDSDSRWGGLD